MTLAEWLERQESVHARSIDLGLERVARVARALEIDRPPFRVVTVAGTNGKGSTVAWLDSVLRASGYRTGALTSPHLLRYNERVRIDGAQASDAALVSAFERIEQARGRTTLTFFEYNALAGLLVFADCAVDVAVLEVGLGGRLDATNVVDPDVAVLCSVGLDHRDWLGDTLESIGTEKAGIFRAGRPAVLGTPEMPATVYATIERLAAHPLIAQRDFTWTVAAEGWSYHGVQAQLAELPRPALEGAVQYGNAATAFAAYESLPHARELTAAAASAALRSVHVPGRFQIIRLPAPGQAETVEWILDVAHNEPAARVLAANLRARPVAGKTHAICGILRDKDAEAIGRELQDLIDEWILCGLPGARGSSAAELAGRMAVATPAPHLAASVREGCELARAQARPGDRVVAFGSFATVGSTLEWVGYTDIDARPRPLREYA
ncbi:MAG TPA: bifunctional tetrahydrofolate synthase/dihydrofolate synthase [Steroidobacteraceae bacterium]|nr:bifunctional tetrahydrofolate synthase/dihydrofolate synthase [Steroidobacteraceae bacterium]